nr:uncharacterized protein LOC117280298 [Nicotiana tomentosiformis]
MRYPADSIAWKMFDELYQSFASEPRNVRLGLASDGFQPFGNSKIPYSIWPVVLIPYNLPPWLCMKKENFILSMIIPGPESLGDAIDVYLRPLIEELKELWEFGVETFDASTKQNFMLHASLLWTINDFSAYAYLSGWTMNIRKELHPIKIGDKYDLPKACYTLSPEEKHMFFSFLKNLKVPDGFSSNISQCVNLKDRKVLGLKSHDCHVLLQHLLPLALRGILCKSVYEPLIELSLFFNVLGSKCLSMDELEKIDSQISITECKLEKVFPPTFFDVMGHLPIHLTNEAKIAGPSQYRWMYPMERYIYFMKPFIRNRACVEGSIAKEYLATECMTLCSRYLHTMETKFNHLERNYDDGVIESDGGLIIFCQPGRALRGGKPHKLGSKELEQAHFYILKNCDEIQPFLELT